MSFKVDSIPAIERSLTAAAIASALEAVASKVESARSTQKLAGLRSEVIAMRWCRSTVTGTHRS